MISKISIIIILTAFCINCNSQILFGNSSLKDLYERLSDTDKALCAKLADISQNYKLDTLINLNGKEVSVLFRDHKLNKMGIKLNVLDISNKNDSIVLAFIERALFRLSLDKTLPEVINTADIMQLKMFYGNNNLLFSVLADFDELLDSIRTSKHFTLFKNRDLIGVEWKEGGQSIKMIFPNNYQLIIGKNKKELDDDIFGILQKINTMEPLNKQSFIIDDITDSISIIIEKGEDYYNKISSDVYYKWNGIDSVLVFDSKHIGLSVKNLFLKNELAGNRNLKLVQKLYGGRFSEIELPLQNFLHYFENDFDTFIGLEKFKSELIEGTVVFCNKYFNYIHLLHFKTDSSELFNDKGNIEANFYANIPMYNISNLYENFESVDFEKKIDVEFKIP